MVDVAATASRSCDPWRAAARAAASDVGTTGLRLWMPSCRRLVVVVAHPHEELCAAGGLMRELVDCRSSLSPPTFCCPVWTRP